VIWLSVVIVLLGAELNAEMERQTARDSTAGRPKPARHVLQSWAGPTVSAVKAWRDPRGLGRPAVLSRAVWRSISAFSSAPSSTMRVCTSVLFSWYVASFDSYNRVYGSLGAGVGFMT
jgi:uncharacterized BrkB/YihY/UPF0761 family membrane protein